MTNARRAFTLIELLVAVALLVLLTGVVVFVFSKSVQVFIVADARAQIFQNVRAGIDMLRRDLMTAEPLLKSDGTATNMQRLRIENRKYQNTKWPKKADGTDLYYPCDVLQIWKLTAPMKDGTSGSVYAKYFLDIGAPTVLNGTGNPETPTLKRKTSPVDPTVGSAWYARSDAWDAGSGDAVTTATSDLTEELMQYVVGFDVEPYYPNAGKKASDGVTEWFGDAHWNLDTQNGTGGNDFKDSEGSLGVVPNQTCLRLVTWDPTGCSDVGVISNQLGPWTNGPPQVFNVSSIPDVATGFYVKRAVFSTANPGPIPSANATATNQRAVSPLPTGFRLTFYIRDERSKEQRAMTQTIWIPMWGG